jgi:hypothetical protein
MNPGGQREHQANLLTKKKKSIITRKDIVNPFLELQ